MRFVVAGFLIASSVAACAGQEPIRATEFYPHRRFAADACNDKATLGACRSQAREKAFSECRHDAANRETQAVAANRGSVLSSAIDGAHARMLALQSCMDAKGFGWDHPRWGR